MFRGDLRHSGVYAGPAVRRLDAVKWRFATGGPVRSSPAVVGGTAYFGSGDGHLYAVDAATGAERWRFATGGAVPSSPAVVGGTVYFTSRDGKVYALDAADGAQRWAHATGPELPYEWAFDYYTSSPAVAGGVVYAGSGDGKVYALDAATGAVRWTHDAGARVRASPAVVDGVVYVGDMAGRLYALDASSGKAIWTFASEGAALDPADFGFDRQALVSSPAVAGDLVGDLVIVGGRDGFLYAVDAATGAERWRVDHQVSWVISSPAVADGVVYTGTSDGQFVQAVDLATGAERWRTPVRGTAWPSPAVADGMLYIGASGGRLYALDTATGTKQWTFRAGSSFHAGPVVAGGVVYTGNDDGALYALAGSAEPGTGASLHRVVYWEETDWPMWFGDGRDVYLKQTFAEAGYEVVDAEGLAAFMEARVADGAPGVVAFVNHYVPPSVLADTSEAALLRRYLAHGRVVWMSPPPLAWVRDPATGAIRGLDYGVVERVLGIRYPGPDTRGMGGLYGVQVTDEGRRWGLRGGWVANSAVHPAQVTTVLARDERGMAGAWLKHYGGPPGTGLLQLWVDRQNPEDLDAVLNAAEHGL